MARTYEVIGTTEDGVTIVLETPVPVRGRVRIWVDASTSEAVSTDRDSVLEAIHARQRARGHQPMSAEEIEAYIRETRGEDDDAKGVPG